MDKVNKLLGTIMVAALVTTLVIPRSGGQSPAKAVKGWFDISTNAATSVLGVRPSAKPTVKQPVNQPVKPGSIY